ncbi:MAG: hypothetical protein PWQ96_184 [Clostridia bacterium]|nr:beta-lactamase domain protein [Clostridiales bacterium]MDK2984542.1 hypothetical protein [Clostridia bacterium]
MKLTVLGNWSPYPAADGACSGYLIEGDGTKILLECGNGIVGKLHKHCKAWDLDAVIVSHLHADHCGDLAPLRYAINAGFLYKYRKDKLPVFITGQPSEKLQPLLKFNDCLRFYYFEDITDTITEYGTIKKQKIKNLQVEFFKVKHSIPAYAVAVTAMKKRIVYSADTEYIPELESFAFGADLFLCEASVLEKDMDYARGKHLVTKQAGELAKKAEVKKFLPTHFFPEYEIETIKKEVEEGFGGEVHLPQIGESYEI